MLVPSVTDSDEAAAFDRLLQIAFGGKACKYALYIATHTGIEISPRKSARGRLFHAVRRKRRLRHTAAVYAVRLDLDRAYSLFIFAARALSLFFLFIFAYRLTVFISLIFIIIYLRNGFVVISRAARLLFGLDFFAPRNLLFEGGQRRRGVSAVRACHGRGFAVAEAD